MSSFFYGYVSTQLIGGLLGSKLGGVKLIGYGVLNTAILTILTPLAARYSVYLVIVLRVIEGVFEVCNTAIAHWFIFLKRVFFLGSRVPRHTRRVVKMGTARRTHSVGVVRFFWQFCGHGRRISIMWMACWKLRMALYILCTRYIVTNNVYAREVCMTNLWFACLGVIAIIWCIIWLTCITESPTDDKHITKEELKYIVDSIGPTDDKKGTCLNH